MACGRAIALCCAGLASWASAAAYAGPPPCGGLLQPQCPPPQEGPPQQSDPTPPGMAKVTVRSSASDIGLGQKIMITGRVTRAAEARPRIVLRTESRDYLRAWPDVGGRTDRAGRFRFSVQPEINTAFRVAVADGESRQGQSPPVEVRVYPFAAVSFAPTNGRTVEVMLDLDGPDIARFANEDVRVLPGTARYGYYYLVPHGSNRAYRLGRARLRTAGCSSNCVRHARLRVRVTRKLRRGGVLGCIHGTAYLGMGLPDPACGRRVVRLR